MNFSLNVIGGLLVAFGVMAIAGSAGDCDGKCVEQANTLGTMLWTILGGFVAIAVGGWIFSKGN